MPLTQSPRHHGCALSHGGAAVLLIATLPWLVSCGTDIPSGTLDPGGIGTVVITGMVRPADGRDIAFGTTMSNSSDSQTITFSSVALIGARSVELVDAVTMSIDAQVSVGTFVPPKSTDDGLDTDVANWALRQPLTETTLGPGEYRQLMLVVRLTSSDDCLSVQGFRIHYREFGHDLTIDANMAMVFYDMPADINTAGAECQAIDDYLQANPIK